MPGKAPTVATALAPRTRYDSTFRATALALLDANQGNLRRTASELGVNESTLRYWSSGGLLREELDSEAQELRAAKREQLADAIEDIAWRSAAQVTDRLHESSARDAAVVMGIAVEKVQLLRGLPTKIHGTADPVLAELTPEQLGAIREALDRRRQRLEIEACVVVDSVNMADGDNGMSPVEVQGGDNGMSPGVNPPARPD